MRVENSDLHDSEFMRLVRIGDFVGAHEALDRLAIKGEMQPSTHARWKTHAHQLEGRIDDALAVLAPHAAVEDIPGKLLRHQRARICIWSCRLNQAKSDLQALLDDAHPKIQSLHTGCRFQLAYIFAMQGDPQLESIIEGIADDATYFIKDSILDKPELERRYRGGRRRSR